MPCLRLIFGLSTIAAAGATFHHALVLHSYCLWGFATILIETGAVIVITSGRQVFHKSTGR